MAAPVAVVAGQVALKAIAMADQVCYNRKRTRRKEYNYL